MPINFVQRLGNATGLEIIPHPLFNQDNQANEMRENHNDMVIAAVPVSSWNPEHVEGSKGKKRRRTSSNLDEEIEKDFSIREIFKCNSIDEVNLYKENGRTIHPQELLKNLKGWTIKKRKRDGSGGNERKDKFYCHPKLKRKLRSLRDVKRWIEEDSYLSKDSHNGEGSKVDIIDGKGMRPKTTDGLKCYGRVDELVKDDKQSRKSKPVKCWKCHNQGLAMVNPLQATRRDAKEKDYL